MRLKDYKKKRNFNKTLEPKEFHLTPHTAQLRFVIHKHAAKRLHYDLRLEMNGVLKSWAVPKGPSLNPQHKHLAIMVEDHPYEYKDFEGVIPKGNYGAGEVIIWDEGTYEILENQLKKGKLIFVLHGEKLKGEFSLIKLKNVEDNSWLLIKKDDKFSSAKDILKQDKSVRHSQLSSYLLNSPKIKMPKLIDPMLATLVDKPFTNKNWWFEIKWDGYRTISFLKNKNVRLMTRNHKDYSKIFYPITKALAKLQIAAILDGEIVAVDQSGTSHFNLLQQFQKNGKGNLLYYIFDILWLNGHDLRALPLWQRKQILLTVISSDNYLKISDHLEERGEEFLRVAVEYRLEGIMAKDRNSPYESGKRGNNWLKIKLVQQQEVIICGYTAPRGSRKNIGALILGVYKNHHLSYIGHVGTGFSEHDLAQIKRRLDRLSQSQCPFKQIPDTNAKPTWVKPQLVCEVAFSEWTEEGFLRHPVFLGLRIDKLARAIRQEHVQPAHKIVDESTVTIDEHPIKLTNLSKVFWPEEHYTKSDVIEYYRTVSNFILPYLKDRAESLNRHPNGIDGNNFYQKNIIHPPEWIKTKIIHSKSENRNIEYIICQNEATLIYMANMGCIEIHPWLSRLENLQHPDFCVIDLDPEQIGFEQVIMVAREVHKLLDKIGADNYCKTSGSRGLHICIPLNAKYTYQQSQQFANLIGIAVNQLLPDITSIIRSPKKRQGKVYLDFLQNRYGQTIVAPYAIRPKLAAPISTPLHWHEVTKKLIPQKFTLKTILKRLDKIGDIWQPVLGKGINLNHCMKGLSHIL